MIERYADIMGRCLAKEDKAHREAVLDEYPVNMQHFVRRLMAGIAKRLAVSIHHTGDRERRGNPSITVEELRGLRRQRLDAIQPKWLRDRVETIVRERWRAVRQEQARMREALR